VRTKDHSGSLCLTERIGRCQKSEKALQMNNRLMLMLLLVATGCRNGQIDVHRLRYEVEKGDRDFVKATVRNADDANLRLPGRHSGEFTFALNLACMRGDIDLVEFLISKGANRDAQDGRGRTALMDTIFAGPKGASNCISTLIRHGASLKPRDRDGADALLHAVFSGHPTLVALLLENGADAHSTYPDGFTPLHYAEDRETALLLIRHGADTRAKSATGLTPAEMARQNGRPSVAEVISKPPTAP
jgi:ankyrin repeat protein